jgi:DNA repair protein RadB
MDTKISSGSAVMDWLLEGGFEKGVITTIYGPAGSGKTNMLLICIANSVKGEKVIYVDTEGSFSFTRFKQICSDDFKKALEKIIFIKPTDFSEQEKAITKLDELIDQNIGAIFVDSISMLYRVELNDENNRPLNNAFVAQLRSLLEIARKKDIPIIITSQVYADMEEKDEVKVVGGMMIKNMSKCLIELKPSGKNRLAIIKKHRSIEDGKSIMYKIIEEGVIEVNSEQKKESLMDSV